MNLGDRCNKEMPLPPTDFDADADDIGAASPSTQLGHHVTQERASSARAYNVKQSAITTSFSVSTLPPLPTVQGGETTSLHVVQHCTAERFSPRSSPGQLHSPLLPSRGLVQHAHAPAVISNKGKDATSYTGDSDDDSLESERDAGSAFSVQSYVDATESRRSDIHENVSMATTSEDASDAPSICHFEDLLDMASYVLDAQQQHDSWHASHPSTLLQNDARQLVKQWSKRALDEVNGNKKSATLLGFHSEHHCALSSSQPSLDWKDARALGLPENLQHQNALTWLCKQLQLYRTTHHLETAQFDDQHQLLHREQTKLTGLHKQLQYEQQAYHELECFLEQQLDEVEQLARGWRIEKAKHEALLLDLKLEIEANHHAVEHLKAEKQQSKTALAELQKQVEELEQRYHEVFDRKEYLKTVIVELEDQEEALQLTLSKRDATIAELRCKLQLLEQNVGATASAGMASNAIQGLNAYGTTCFYNAESLLKQIAESEKIIADLQQQVLFANEMQNTQLQEHEDALQVELDLQRAEHEAQQQELQTDLDQTKATLQRVQQENDEAKLARANQGEFEARQQALEFALAHSRRELEAERLESTRLRRAASLETAARVMPPSSSANTEDADVDSPTNSMAAARLKKEEKLAQLMRAQEDLVTRLIQDAETARDRVDPPGRGEQLSDRVELDKNNMRTFHKILALAQDLREQNEALERELLLANDHERARRPRLTPKISSGSAGFGVVPPIHDDENAVRRKSQVQEVIEQSSRKRSEFDECLEASRHSLDGFLSDDEFHDLTHNMSSRSLNIPVLRRQSHTSTVGGQTTPPLSPRPAGIVAAENQSLTQMSPLRTLEKEPSKFSATLVAPSIFTADVASAERSKESVPKCSCTSPPSIPTAAFKPTLRNPASSKETKAAAGSSKVPLSRQKSLKAKTSLSKKMSRWLWASASN